MKGECNIRSPELLQWSSAAAHKGEATTGDGPWRTALPRRTSIRLIPHFSRDLRKQEGNDRQHDRSEHARLRAHRTASQPGRPMETAVEQIVIGRKPAVGNAVEERLTPVPSRVKPHRQPQGPPAFEKEAEQKRKPDDGD